MAAIAIPRLGSFRDDAQTQADIATARTILSAASIAEADKGAAFTEADVESHLDMDITLATTAPTNTPGWVLVVPATGDMSVYLDNTLIDVTP